MGASRLWRGSASAWTAGRMLGPKSGPNEQPTASESDESKMAGRKKRRSKPIDPSHKSLVRNGLVSNEFRCLYAKRSQFRHGRGRDMEGMVMPKAFTKRSLADSASGSQTDTESAGQTWKLYRNEPNSQLQFAALQWLTSDGLVPPPKTNPNQGMWYRVKSSAGLSEGQDGEPCEELRRGEHSTRRSSQKSQARSPVPGRWGSP